MKYFLSFLFFFFFSLSGFTKVVVGSKNFTEQLILGEMISLLLEKKYNKKVERRLNLGGSSLTFQALKAGSIDIYVEYTGTGYINILKQKKVEDSDQVYRFVRQEFEKRYNILWSQSLGFNNTYGLAVREDDTRFQNIETFSQWVQLAQKTPFKFGAPHEFFVRVDGYNGLAQSYGLSLPSKFKVGLDPGLMYRALIEEEVDLITAFTTDGRISEYNLKVLKDNLNFFPPYEAALLIRKEIYKTSPIFKKLFEDFENLISEKEMIEMNYQVDVKKRSSQKVALEFLEKKNLLEKTMSSNSSSFLSDQKNFLFRMIGEHLVLVFVALLLSLLVSLPLGVFLVRKQAWGNSVFAVLNTFQTIPSLALLGLLIPIMGIGFWSAITALFLYSLLPLVRNTYEGLKGIPKGLVEGARSLGFSSWQILRLVEVPLAFPIILAGFRTALVILIGLATLADLIGAGGLGRAIFIGLQTVNTPLILLGALPAAFLAMGFDFLLGLLEKRWKHFRV